MGPRIMLCFYNKIKNTTSNDTLNLMYTKAYGGSWFPRSLCFKSLPIAPSTDIHHSISPCLQTNYPISSSGYQKTFAVTQGQQPTSQTSMLSLSQKKKKIIQWEESWILLIFYN